MKRKKMNFNFNQNYILNNIDKLRKTKKQKYLKNIIHSYYSEINHENLYYKLKESNYELNFKAKLILDKKRNFSNKEIIEFCKFICFLEKSKRIILDQLDLNDDDHPNKNLFNLLNIDKDLDEDEINEDDEDEDEDEELNSENDIKKIEMGFKTNFK